jgi:hypothetical protein
MQRKTIDQPSIRSQIAYLFLFIAGHVDQNTVNTRRSRSKKDEMTKRRNVSRAFRLLASGIVEFQIKLVPDIEKKIFVLTPS